MIELEHVSSFARAREISYADSFQTFMQVVVLRHLTLTDVRLLGGTALVLGFHNPRFSEDLDFTNLPDPAALESTLSRARKELAGWVGREPLVTPPKEGKSTWRLTIRFGRAESIRLHIDSQRFQALTRHPIVIEYPGFSTIVVESLALSEIMAEKLIAVTMRKYLGGRDLFDLWFHWLRDGNHDMTAQAVELLARKLRDRKLARRDWHDALQRRLRKESSLDRAEEEWRRYLPQRFQKESVFSDIIEKCRTLPSLLLL